MSDLLPKSNFNNNFILVGYNKNMVPFSADIVSYSDLPAEVTHPTKFIGNNKVSFNSISTSNVRSQLRIKLVPEGSQEAATIFDGGNYDGFSIMSLDGLLSPVSFYPSDWSSTFNMTLYSRSSCPWCDGTNRYESFSVSQDINTYPEKVSRGTEACPFCMPDVDKTSQTMQTVTVGSEIEPPHIITDSDDDSTTISDINAGDEFSRINRFTLNPIVMQDGEFSNSDARQKGDTSAHCIDSVGFGSSPGAVRSLVGDGSSNFTSAYNQRFMALRGPLMLHSWGYDINGFPVPNASGDYKYVNGQVLTDGGVPIYATQKRQSNGTWSDPAPSHQFKKGWAQLAHKWPVGPIDLRWDDNAGVWTIGANYKNVWITIETDLTVKNSAVRGAIYQEGPTTLPNGQRKVVFVKDTLGVVAAPRRATIYCKYNQDSGYYQPLFATNLMAVGTIQSNTSAEITTSYSIDKNEQEETYTASYVNPLGLSAGSSGKGIFGFINGEWTLVSVSS